MTPAVKFLIGLAAVVAMGWIHHGPLGNGEALVGKIEAEAQAAVSGTGLPVTVRMQRDPLARVAILSGQADEFQREGQGSLKGINDLVRETEGVADLRWTDAPAADEPPIQNELQVPGEAAGEREARLREKAKTDPDGANAEAIDNMSRNETVATAINSAGFLCARVTNLQSVGGGQMLVDCVEYRDGTGRVSYRVDANAGTVERR